MLTHTTHPPQITAHSNEISQTHSNSIDESGRRMLKGPRRGEWWGASSPSRLRQHSQLPGHVLHLSKSCR